MGRNETPQAASTADNRTVFASFTHTVSALLGIPIMIGLLAWSGVRGELLSPTAIPNLVVSVALLTFFFIDGLSWVTVTADSVTIRNLLRTASIPRSDVRAIRKHRSSLVPIIGASTIETTNCGPIRAWALSGTLVPGGTRPSEQLATFLAVPLEPH